MDISFDSHRTPDPYYDVAQHGFVERGLEGSVFRYGASFRRLVEMIRTLVSLDGCIDARLTRDALNLSEMLHVPDCSAPRA